MIMNQLTPSSVKYSGSKIRNVIFIAVDCLKFCYLRRGGNSVNACPTINSLAEEGIFCENARAHSNPTQLSYPAVFSSSLPLDYGGYDHGVLKRPRTIAEVLRDVGLYTIGFSPSPWLGRFFGYDRGFDEFYELFDINKFWVIFADIYHRFYSKLLHGGIISEAGFCEIVGDLFGRFIAELLRLCEQTKNELECDRFPYDVSLHRHNFSLYQSILKSKQAEFLVDPHKYILTNLTGEIINSIKPFLTGIIEQADQRRLSSYPHRAVRKLLRLFGVQFRYYNHSLSAAYFAREVNSAISNNKEKPFFIWTHFLDIHDSFCIPGTVGLPPAMFTLGFRRLCDTNNCATIKRTFSLRFVDKQVARIIDKLKTEDLLDSTLVVIYGDHGFGVNSPDKSAGNMFDESARVPIIFFNSHIEPRVISQPCGLLDIAPTVLTLMGVSPPDEFDGISLIKKPEGQRPIILESLGAGPGDFRFKAIKIAVVQGKYKLIWRERGYEDSCPDHPNYLFDIESDPQETKNLYDNEEYAPVISALEKVATERVNALREKNLM